MSYYVIAVLGTFDSKGDEHLFLKERIEAREVGTVTVHTGTRAASPFPADYDLFREVVMGLPAGKRDRDQSIQAVLEAGRKLIRELHDRGEIQGVVSAGGGTGTHLATAIMRALPIGVPKVMVSTVASRDMSEVVGTRDVTMMHSVADILGVNSLLGPILDAAAGAVCGMARITWTPRKGPRRIALTMFGFITAAAGSVKTELESMGYEVVAFHANGTGGMAMEELAAEGFFDGIMDLATHELADELKGGYCRGIGPQRLAPAPGKPVPRLVVPGGLDCAVLEFTRETVPLEYQDRPVFFYDFRSAVRLTVDESLLIAEQVAEKLNLHPRGLRVLVPWGGWSEADGPDKPLWAPETSRALVNRLRRDLDPAIPLEECGFHINDPAFAAKAARAMHEMLQPVPIQKRFLGTGKFPIQK
ncbi:MAG: Tm-1-like ATP-binding domain-containing protein [Thermodesulfobacteriota bacterium]